MRVIENRSVCYYGSLFHSARLNILTRSTKWKIISTLSPASHMICGHLTESLIKNLGLTRIQIRCEIIRAGVAVLSCRLYFLVIYGPFI